ncbi:MAG: peptide-methionine (S)-S-oxide reductase MsrA [Coxiellaceae bacterium]|nr:peptide-methionine (S)-S-oxide reductase MsrA [Coxiellaceae bacterium]
MRILLITVLSMFCMVAVAKDQTAIFAGGCFWCMEADFDKVPGVVKTESGYDGGTKPNPTYETVSAGLTHYAEVLKVTYDPKKVSYQQLLTYFWKNIDPTAKDAQFCDRGAQYRSAIFYLNPEQKKLAEQSLIPIKQKFKTVYTEITASTHFYPAEQYHQDYYKKNPVRYKFYRWNCGRDKRLKQLYGR